MARSRTESLRARFNLSLSSMRQLLALSLHALDWASARA